LNVFPTTGHLFIHKQNKGIDEMACKGEIWHKLNKVNKYNVEIYGKA
jgi:hypothetical protein